MKISYNWLKSHLKTLPQPQKLADLLTLHSFEVKSVDKRLNDYLLDIDVLPNRAHDCLCHLGVAKECAALLKKKIHKVEPKIAESKSKKINEFLSLEVKDKEKCLRYNARMISGIKIGPSPKWLAERLESIGQKSINNVVDATNYVMFDLGQPLHCFDYEKIEGKKIIVRKARSGEEIITLDGEKLKLDDSVLVIADAYAPLALAGVKGGKKAEITAKTKTVVLESANFSISAVRSTIRKTGIKTEASMRFEHGLDPNLTIEAIDVVAELIKRIAGGEIIDGIIDIYPQKVFAKKIKLNPQKIFGMLGKEVSISKIKEILTSLGFEIDNALKVTVPTIRQDIEIEEDLIEEIARMIGYGNIPPQHPLGFLGISKSDDSLIITNKIKSILESLGFNEVYNFSFVGEGDIQKLNLNIQGYLELENPLSADLKYLRRDLIVNLLKNVKDNAKNFLHLPEGIRIFELGNIYYKNGEAKEEKMLAAMMATRKEEIKGERFYELKGVVDVLLNKLGITDQWYDDYGATPDDTDVVFWQEGHTAEIKVGDEEIGFLGYINPRILNALNIKGTVVALNLNFKKILKLATEELIYQPPSPYPAAIRDLAIFVDLKDRVADVLNVIEITGGDLVQDVDLFDIYEGEGIPDGKKSLAFHIVYQSYEKTLTDEEVDKIHRKIIRELEKNNNWQVRR